jgi:hypothetical protein
MAQIVQIVDAASPWFQQQGEVADGPSAGPGTVRVRFASGAVDAREHFRYFKNEQVQYLAAAAPSVGAQSPEKDVLWRLRALRLDLWAWVERDDVPSEVSEQIALQAKAVDALIWSMTGGAR